LVERGYQVAIPFGEDSDFDLVLLRGDKNERVQVKYSTSKDGVMPVHCYSNSLTNGKVRRRKHYTARMIEWLAIYESTTDRCFYVNAAELGEGKSTLHLRLEPTRNNQSVGIRYAEDYCDLEVRSETLM
jgi:hypothetical protein